MSKFVKIPGESPIFKPIEVTVRGDSKESFESAVRIFKALVQKEKVLSLYKEKQSYEKPSVKRRRKRKEAEEKRFIADLKQKKQEASDKRRK